MNQQIQALYRGSRMTDLVLVASDGEELNVHRTVMAARSEVFEMMLTHDSKERRSGRVDIDDIDSKTLSLLVDYIYDIQDGLKEMTSGIDLRKLFVAAHKYQLPSLLELCSSKLAKIKLAIPDCAEHYLFAKRYDLKGEMEKVVQRVRLDYQQFCTAGGLEAIVTAGPEALESFTGELAKLPVTMAMGPMKSANSEIRICVLLNDPLCEMQFRVRPTSPMLALWAAIETRTGVPRHSLRLLYDGTWVRYTDTPETLNMKEGKGHEMNAYQLQMG